jgi:hypothetical protein
MLNYDYSKLKREEELSASSEYLHLRFLGHVIRLASLPSNAYPVTCLYIVRAVTTLAVRGVVEPFRSLDWEKELDQEILAFSISHRDDYVPIHGHYPKIDGAKTTYYHYRLRVSS